MPVAIASESGCTYQAQSERNVERGDLPFEHPHGMSDARIDGPFEITADRGEMLSGKLRLRTFHRIDKVWKYTDRCGLCFDDTAIRIIGQATAPGALGELGLHRLNVCPEAAARRRHRIHGNHRATGAKAASISASHLVTIDRRRPPTGGRVRPQVRAHRAPCRNRAASPPP